MGKPVPGPVELIRSALTDYGEEFGYVADPALAALDALQARIERVEAAADNLYDATRDEARRLFWRGRPRPIGRGGFYAAHAERLMKAVEDFDRALSAPIGSTEGQTLKES